MENGATFNKQHSGIGVSGSESGPGSVCLFAFRQVDGLFHGTGTIAVVFFLVPWSPLQTRLLPIHNFVVFQCKVKIYFRKGS